MRLFLLVALCMATGHYTTIKDKIKKLHDLTGQSTYYEFFGLCENATRDQIKKAFRKLRKAAPPASLTSEQYKSLVEDGYSLLLGIRNAYDEFLSHSKYIYLDEVANYRNHFYLMLFVGIIALLFLDLFVYAIRYGRYYDGLEKQRVAKKAKKRSKARTVPAEEDAPENGKAATKKQPSPPTAVVHYLLRRVRRCFGK